VPLRQATSRVGPSEYGLAARRQSRPPISSPTSPARRLISNGCSKASNRLCTPRLRTTTAISLPSRRTPFSLLSSRGHSRLDGFRRRALRRSAGEKLSTAPCRRFYWARAQPPRRWKRPSGSSGWATMTEATLQSSTSGRSLAPKGAKQTPRRRSRDLIGLLYIAPVMLVLLVVLILPAIFAVVYSLLELKSVRPVGFAGLENYRELFSDPAMAAVLVRTLVFTVITVALTLAVALAVAVFLNRLTARRALVVQILVILPWVISTIVGALLFRWFFVTDISPGVYLLSQVGIEAKPLTDPALSMISLILVAVWRTLGFAVLLLLAGLKSVPSEFYEAATMD